MKKYVETYLEYFSYSKSDWIGCEICNATAVDIHHIDARGMGGSKEKDNIENLMALCRICHMKYGDKKKFIEILKNIHLEHIDKRSRLN